MKKHITDLKRLFEIAGVANLPMARTLAFGGDNNDMQEPEDEFADSELTDMENDEDAVDTIQIDVPTLIRAMEFAREDAGTDDAIHQMAERLVAASKDGVVTMSFFDNQ